MKNTTILIGVICLLAGCSVTRKDDFITRSMDVARQQTLLMAEYMARYPDRLPLTYCQELDSIFITGSRNWISGYFPGVLWYMYEYHNDENLKKLAESFLSRVEKEKYSAVDHDIGLQIGCSFGNAFRLTKDEAYKDVILTTAQTLSKRFNKNIGLIRSWDFGSDKWQFPVIIDNMVTLEPLVQAFQFTGDSLYYNIVVSHSDNTLKNHFRPDHSSYHIVSYDTVTWLPQLKRPGNFIKAAWARGQAWGLYGYTYMYRETGLERYLNQAVHIANFMIDHPNMPGDMIPYWDFMCPDIPDTYRDASAAAIMASALIELSSFVDPQLQSKYLRVAETQLRTLSTPEYLAEPGTNGFFILKRGAGSMVPGRDLDVPLPYSDYYFVEALIRFSNL